MCFGEHRIEGASRPGRGDPIKSGGYFVHFRKRGQRRNKSINAGHHTVLAPPVWGLVVDGTDGRARAVSLRVPQRKVARPVFRPFFLAGCGVVRSRQGHKVISRRIQNIYQHESEFCAVSRNMDRIKTSINPTHNRQCLLWMVR